ncbi:MAG TPA: helix-turn-helix transcriptional regulator [Verrucomicrobiae bacterium]|jgi:transcriptional regulator with XRE-family HTH domain|nr:helix-turn-helix transcriptional regulator [Verrucomicrobiae bacterium]
MNDDESLESPDLIWRTENLGGLLRALRRDRGISIARLEELTGVGHSEIHRVETGQTECRIESLIRLSASLGVKPGWALDRILWTNVALYHRRILAEPAYRKTLERLGISAAEMRARLADTLASAAALAALLLRCCDPISRARDVDYPHIDWKKRFTAYAAKLGAMEEGVDRAAILNSLLREPTLELGNQGLLPETALKEQSRAVKDAEGKKKTWGWTPWLYQYQARLKLS